MKQKIITLVIVMAVAIAVLKMVSSWPGSEPDFDKSNVTHAVWGEGMTTAEHDQLMLRAKATR